MRNIFKIFDGFLFGNVRAQEFLEKIDIQTAVQPFKVVIIDDTVIVHEGNNVESRVRIYKNNEEKSVCTCSDFDTSSFIFEDKVRKIGGSIVFDLDRIGEAYSYPVVIKI